ncbi:uncharacterized protein LOC120639312 [Panicum virgatum]|uniref:Uncharacterized protein n=1 Tax=Panicum virgatum TaxID=38727 RepID=A0A8T0R6H5_PANVG|nr:uncharacterized protein LOC120639312 [Panicum virgatum]KAG2581297.1 hypothetical protein PVAP13_6KG039100 [Panicum virgatum]
MELLAALMKMVSLISEALRNVEKLPAALISGGGVQAAADLALAVFKAPTGIFLHNGKGLFYLYYGVLIGVGTFGFVEASVDFWVSGDLNNWHRRVVGKTIMWISILPLVLFAGLGGFMIMK